MVAMLADIYPSVFKTSQKGRPILVAAISVICFLIGIPMLTQVISDILFLDFKNSIGRYLCLPTIRQIRCFRACCPLVFLFLLYRHRVVSRNGQFLCQTRQNVQKGELFRLISLHFLLGIECLCVPVDDFRLCFEIFNANRLLARLFREAFGHGENYL